MKCDAGKPVCQQCTKANRAHDCEYDDGKSKSRTQIMQEKILKQEARIRELETIGAGTVGQHHLIASSAPASFPASHSPSFFEDARLSSFSPNPQQAGGPELFAPDFLLPNAASPYGAPTMPASSSSGSASGSPSTSGMHWAIDGFDFGQLVDPAAAQTSSATANGLAAPAPTLPPDDFSWAASLLQAEPVPAWESEDVPLETRQMLLDIFLKHREQCGLQIHVPRFLESLQLPLGSARRPHAALLNSIYLLAARFSANPSLRAFEPRFLARATEAITAALERSDRLVNVIQAECLLAFYLYANGRLLEGFYHASAAARLAIGLGLHQITSCDLASQTQDGAAKHSALAGNPATAPSTGSILPPPADAIELGERIHCFWMAFNIDRAWAVATGMPVAFSDGDHSRTQVDTVWPRSLADFEAGQVSDAEYATVRNLFVVQQQQSQQPRRQDSPETLRSKAVTLFERASRLSAGLSSARTVGDDFWVEFRAIEVAIHRFASSMPSARTARGAASGGTSPAPPAVNTALAFVHTLVYVATIQLHHVFAYMDPASHDKCLAAAAGALAVLRDLGEADARMLDPVLGTAWMCVADVLVREIARLKNVPGGEQQAANASMQLHAVVGAMKQLAEVFPIVGFQVSKVQEARAIA